MPTAPLEAEARSDPPASSITTPWGKNGRPRKWRCVSTLHRVGGEAGIHHNAALTAATSSAGSTHMPG